jgi:very-short-patch-repair endonuclease
MEKKMFYDASGDLFEKARNLRRNMTFAEKLLWERLKENKLLVRFKPQHPIDIFVADFYCHEVKLVIELDGEIHNYQKEKDEARTSELGNYDITVIRFKNSEVINDIESVIAKIKDCINELKSRK